MTDFSLDKITNISSKETYYYLVNKKNSYLIDVRSKAEWHYDGIPDLSKCMNNLILIEWIVLPLMNKNNNFLDEVFENIKIENDNMIFFICRSGIRSFEAAETLKFFLNNNGYNVHCLNVVDGFNKSSDFMPSGDLKGWKSEGLPWSHY